MKKLIMVIGLVSIVSCATPTNPVFPEIDCIPTQMLSDEQLTALKECKQGVAICLVSRETMLLILNNYQNKASCLEGYKAAAGEFK